MRAAFDAGALSSDFGPLLMGGIDRQIGLTERLANAIQDRRHLSYIDHPLRDLLRQRIFQMTSGYEDQNDATPLRQDPLFKLGLERLPLEPDHDLASQPTHSRLENAVRRADLYRMAVAFVEQFVASYAEPPPAIVVDLDHSEDRTHGQQTFSFDNGHYGHHCYLPLYVFEGLSGRLITAVLRPGKTPTGRENAMIVKRIFQRLRPHWSDTHILLRGDGHFSNPELMDLVDADPRADFVCG
ncbi:MAG: IS1380 family transposase, partial [bacterium]|nr:IS1380 family transposase [bacterium]